MYRLTIDEHMKKTLEKYIEDTYMNPVVLDTVGLEVAGELDKLKNRLVLLEPFDVSDSLIPSEWITQNDVTVKINHCKTVVEAESFDDILKLFDIQLMDVLHLDKDSINSNSTLHGWFSNVYPHYIGYEQDMLSHGYNFNVGNVYTCKYKGGNILVVCYTNNKVIAVSPVVDDEKT